MSSSRDSASEESVDAFRRAVDQLARAVRSWSDEDARGFLDGQFDLELVPKQRGASSGSKRRSQPWNGDVESVRQAFARMDTREAGFAYLDELALNRTSLRDLAIALDLPATRADNIERIRNRIVESLIGYRLRSRAVRGKALPPPDDDGASGDPTP